MGADHTAGYAIATNILKVGGDVDPLSTEGQIELSRNLQIATAALDATGYCLFIAFAILDQEETFNAMVETINGMYDWSLTGDDVVALGKKILSMEREFNKKAGFTKEHDRLPRYMSVRPSHPTTSPSISATNNWTPSTTGNSGGKQHPDTGRAADRPPFFFAPAHQAARRAFAGKKNAHPRQARCRQQFMSEKPLIENRYQERGCVN